MKTNIDVMKRRFPFEKVAIYEKKRSKTSMKSLHIEGLDTSTTNLFPGRSSCEKKSDLGHDPNMVKAVRKIDNNAPLNEFIGIKGTDCNEREHLETHAGFETGAGDGPASDSHDEENCDDLLKAREAELKEETSQLIRQLQKHANRCEKMREANELLLEELKSICEPGLIARLVAMNPDESTEIEEAQQIQCGGDAYDHSS